MAPEWRARACVDLQHAARAALNQARPLRTGAVVDEALSEEFSGVLVSDFAAAYNHYPRLNQRCWVHLLRDIHDLREAHPDDRGLARWTAAVKAV